MQQNNCANTTDQCIDPIEALKNDKDNIVNKNVFLKYSVTIFAAAISVWFAGYLFTKGALAAGGKLSI